MDKARKIKIPNECFFAEVAEALREGKTVTIPMRGVSMLPLLRQGRDSVRLAAASGANVSRGDVALFWHNGRYVLHRLVGRKGAMLHFRGDGLLGNGEYCREDDVAATVTHVLRERRGQVSTSSLHWRLVSGLWLAVRPIVLRLPLLRSLI